MCIHCRSMIVLCCGLRVAGCGLRVVPCGMTAQSSLLSSLDIRELVCACVCVGVVPLDCSRLRLRVQPDMGEVVNNLMATT